MKKNKHLVVHYAFDGTLDDQSGNGHHATISGTADYVQGPGGRCLRLDDRSAVVTPLTMQHLIAPARNSGKHRAADAVPEEFTIEFWVQPDASMGERGIDAINEIININFGAYHWHSFSLPGVLPVGEWSHLAYVRKGNLLDVCLNGICVHTVSSSPGAMGHLANPPLRIGEKRNSEACIFAASRQGNFAGLIKDFRIWTTNLYSFPLAEIPRQLTAATAARFLKPRLRQHSSAQQDDRHAATIIEIELTPDRRQALASLESISLGLQLERASLDGTRGEVRALPLVLLHRADDFTARCTLPADVPPGFGWLTARATLDVDGRQISSEPAVFSFVIAPQPVDAVVRNELPALSAAIHGTTTLDLTGNPWRIAIDPKNHGREQKWFLAAPANAIETRVPSIIQEHFPDYHGVAWYWTTVQPQPNPHKNGRALLRFEAVDYLADVWVNGRYVGGHEGGESPFVLDITNAVIVDKPALIAVRVLNPTKEPIDGIRLDETPHGMKTYPIKANLGYNAGGIVDAVSLIMSPPVQITDVNVLADWETGKVELRIAILNSGDADVRSRIGVSVAPATGGPPIVGENAAASLVRGENLISVKFIVPNHRLWELNDPFLYRLTVTVQAEHSESNDQSSVRFGFKDFRFADGYFRLNGRRILIHGTLHIINNFPIGYLVPHDPDLVRRDIANMKAAGFNMARISIGAGLARLLDACDELGVLAYQEHNGAWLMEESPRLEPRYDRSIGEIIRRDRNHVSVAAWGLLNETPDSRLFRHAIDILPALCRLDDTRLIILSSGRFDHDDRVGSMSSPGSRQWDIHLKDEHTYPGVPHPEKTITYLRTLKGESAGAKGGKALLLSEYGVCSAEHYPRLLRNFEQAGKQGSADARFYQEQYDKLLADWKAWKLDKCFARPEDYFDQSQALQARLWTINFNAIRSNPDLVGSLSSVSIVDAWYHGCGVFDHFRNPKRGLLQAAQDLAAPVRWCLFAEPWNVYRGGMARLEAVLANNDALAPGKYPAVLQIAGPDDQIVWRKRIVVEIPPARKTKERPFTSTVYSGNCRMNGPAGAYRLQATFEHGADATAGEISFFVSDPLPRVHSAPAMMLWNENAKLQEWCQSHGVRVIRRVSANPKVIIVSGVPERDVEQSADQLLGLIRNGATACFLDFSIWKDPRLAKLKTALLADGTYRELGQVGGYFHHDVWAKRHPIFDGMPTGGIVDYVFYRNLIPYFGLIDGPRPREAICGTLNASSGYIASGLILASYRHGKGTVFLSSLQLLENLSSDPAADRLLFNLISHAANQRRDDFILPRR